MTRPICSLSLPADSQEATAAIMKTLSLSQYVPPSLFLLVGLTEVLMAAPRPTHSLHCKIACVTCAVNASVLSETSVQSHSLLSAPCVPGLMSMSCGHPHLRRSLFFLSGFALS